MSSVAYQACSVCFSINPALIAGLKAKKLSKSTFFRPLSNVLAHLSIEGYFGLFLFLSLQFLKENTRLSKANSADRYQTPRFAVFDLPVVLQCLPRSYLLIC